MLTKNDWRESKVLTKTLSSLYFKMQTLLPVSAQQKSYKFYFMSRLNQNHKIILTSKNMKIEEQILKKIQPKAFWKRLEVSTSQKYSH